MVIITIDGPAGAGKSTVAKRLAEELGFAFLDTGAMYRAMTYAAMCSGINLESPDEVLATCKAAKLEWSLAEIRLNGEDISSNIRTPEVSRHVRFIADHPGLRQILVDKQRELASEKDIVCEGRDQGTVAFPDARFKFFLVASADERARRRVEDLKKRGIAAAFEDILQDQERRDEQDRTRPVGRLQKAADAVEVCTDGMTIDEVVLHLKEWVADQSANMQSSNMKSATGRSDPENTSGARDPKSPTSSPSSDQPTS